VRRSPTAPSSPLSVCLVGLIAGARSGIARYAAALTRALDELCADFPDLRLSLVTTRAGKEVVGARNIDVRDFGLTRARFNEGPPRIALEQLLAARRRADLLHFFDLTGPVLAPRRPFVATVHDVSIAPGLARRRHAYKRRLWPWAARRARALVAVSEFARSEIADRFDVPEAKIEVIHSGPGLTELPSGGANGVPVPESPYFLYVGDLTVRKNVPFLVRAFDRANVDASLLLVGRADDGYAEVAAEVERAGRADRVRVVEHASDRDVDSLYRSAIALVMPSLYEGFGFTPLEAMARGCPVLASDIPAFREVSGSGALLVPLDEEDRWADSLRRLAADEALRRELRERGSRTVARYSWQRTARELCRLFLTVGGRTPA
jgi:glycosyltransferase involved in cell wall biosynthesis